MADFQNPKNTNPLLSLFGYVRDGFDSIARMFDGTTDSNVPVGAKKIDGSGVISQFNGATWDVIGGPSFAQSLTNKTISSASNTITIDADTATVSNIETDNFKASAKHTDFDVDPADGNTSFAMAEGVYDKFQAVSDAIVALTEDYGVYIEDIQTGSSATWDSILIGTRIDTSDPDYLASSFNFKISGVMGINSTFTDPAETTGQQKLHIQGNIKKSSGSQPKAFVIITAAVIASTAGEYSNSINGTFSTSGTELSTTFDASATPITAGSIERVDSSNELCFRLSFTANSSITDANFIASLVGPRNYTGTLITSSNGTIF